VKAHLHVVQSRAQFLEELRSIAKEARFHAHWPILHIEAHGDFTGIYVTSGEYLPWREFQDELIAINESSRLNLLVVMAACKGAWLSKVIASQVRGRAPMRLLIGPKRDVEAREIEQACSVFYRVLFDTGDVGAACRAMNAAVATAPLTFRAFTAEDIFQRVLHGYFSNYCSEDALVKRENERIAHLERLGISGEQLEHDRQCFRSRLRDHRRLFEEFKHRFFFCDLYPENATRFRVTFEDCQRDPSET
jgi:hypothetical protein